MVNKMRILICKRCGWDWGTRKDKTPKYCPKCKSKYWNTERIRKPIHNEIKKEIEVITEKTMAIQ